MDVQLQELIARIKDEGVAAAERRAAEIIRDAEAAAAVVAEKASARAAEIVAKAEAEAARREQSARDAITQAGRDLVLSLRSQIAELYRQVARKEVAKTMTGRALEEAVYRLMESWKPDTAGDLVLVLPEEESREVHAALRERLADQIRAGLEIKASPKLQSGFRVADKDGSGYVDFTAAEVADALAAYLSPHIAELVRAGV